MLFDTHAHFDDRKFDQDRDAMIKKSYEDGVTLIMNPGSSISSSKQSVLLSKKYDFMYCAVGVHPHDATEMDDRSIEILADLAIRDKVKAIGEIGLDYFRDLSPRDIQKKRLIEQIDLAKQLNLPVILHDRDSHEDIMSILRKENIKSIGGVLHSFSGSKEMAKECLKLGLFLSISGPITFSNAKKTVEVVKDVPLEYLLIETDSPYLTPVPHRGERNYSGHVKFVAQKVSEIKNIDFEIVARTTFENGKRLFKI